MGNNSLEINTGNGTKKRGFFIFCLPLTDAAFLQGIIISPEGGRVIKRRNFCAGKEWMCLLFKNVFPYRVTQKRDKALLKRREKSVFRSTFRGETIFCLGTRFLKPIHSRMKERRNFPPFKGADFYFPAKLKLKEIVLEIPSYGNGSERLIKSSNLFSFFVCRKMICGL